jgi:hypothetical protein
MVCTVMQDSRSFQAKLALGMQEWLKRAASRRMEVRDPVCQAFELKISTTRAEPREFESRACRVRYCSCWELVRCEKAVMTELLVRGSRTAKRGVSVRIRVPAGMRVVEKQPRPLPGDGRTV